MPEREDDAEAEGDLGEEETQPITLIGAAPASPPVPAVHSSDEVGSETTAWARGAAPAPIPDLQEAPAADTPVMSAQPVVGSEPARAPVAAPAAAPPPITAPVVPPATASASHNAPAEVVDALSEAATVVGMAAADPGPRSTIAPSSSLQPMLLERIEPSLGRGERVRLDASHWRVSLGRAESNDVQLYTAAASREHAVIAGNEAGEWVLTPAQGKSVKIDGELCAYPVVLEVGMNLVMGTDHLRCVTEGLSMSDMTAQTSADGFEAASSPSLVDRLAGMGLVGWLIGAAALLGIGLIAFALLRGA